MILTGYSQAHELTWGGLVISSEVDPDVPWACRMDAGADLGNPVPLVEAVESLLTDGSLAVVTKYGNREITCRVMLSATDGQALAQAEAAFMQEVLAERPSPLVWTPTAGGAWPCVFDVVTARYEVDYPDDWDLEERRCHRFYLLTFECLPWVRDEETTVIPALPVPTDPNTPAVYETITAISGTSDWTPVVCHSNHFGTVFEDSGTDSGDTWYRAYATNTYTNSTGYIGATRSTTTSLNSLPYLTIDADLSSSPAIGLEPYLAVAVQGTVYHAVAILPLSGGLANRYYFQGLPNTIDDLQVRGYWPVASDLATRRVKIYEVGRTDRIEISGSSGFQIARTATVEGSAPTQAAITFDAGTDPLLGSTALIYTGANAAVPMRQFRASSATVTVDTAMISGAKNDLSSSMVFRIPVNQLSEATYSLMARLNFTGTKTINWSAKITASDGTDIPGSELTVSGDTLATNSTSDAWCIHSIGDIQMPIVSIEGAPTHVVQITLSMTSGGNTVLVDEGWLLDTDNGAVTVVHEPTAFQLTGIEVRSPQLDSPRPAVVGTWTTYGTQDISRLVTAFGAHVFKPGTLHVFTATDLAKYASCELEYYRRYHTYPGPALPSEDVEA